MHYALREALAAVRRAPLLIFVSVVAVGLSLFVVGLFGLAAFNVQAAIDSIQERVEVVAFLRDGTAQEQVRIAEEEIASLPEVLDLRYVSRTEALATAVRELPEFREVFSGNEVNPLPASLEIRLAEGYRTPEATERLAQYVLAYPFVEDVRFGREWVASIFSLQRVAAVATAIIGGALAAVAGIIIATAVRIAVYARREEIEIMRLVGATDGFIRLPFLIEGAFAGVFGGVAAVVLTFMAYRLFVGVTSFDLSWMPLEWLLLSVAAGAAYGLLASAIAVRRHLSAI
jgi:cell division transport system permease protein